MLLAEIAKIKCCCLPFTSEVRTENDATSELITGGNRGGSDVESKLQVQGAFLMMSTRNFLKTRLISCEVCLLQEFVASFHSQASLAQMFLMIWLIIRSTLMGMNGTFVSATTLLSPTGLDCGAHQNHGSPIHKNSNEAKVCN